MSLWILSVILTLILVNALYVAAEFAVVGVRASRLEHLAAEGHRLAAALLPIVRDPARLDRYIAACQIGITLSSLILGAFGQATVALALAAALIDHLAMDPVAAHALAATSVLVLLTSTQVVFGELIPKTVALQYPAGTAMYTYLPMRWSLVLFAPLIRVLNGSGFLVLRLLGVQPESAHRHIHSPDEIDLLIRESSDGGLLKASDGSRLREALRLSQHGIRQIMVPRRLISSLDLDAPLERLLAEIDGSPFTRLVVHRGGIDQVLGFVHVKDLAAALARGRDIAALSPLVRPLLALPDTLTIDRALGQMRLRRARLALVVSEFGDVEGLISLEDIIRELLGRLPDEFKSAPDPAPVPVAENAWRLPGRLPLGEARDWAAPLGLDPGWRESRAETLAGWLLERIGVVPEAGERLTVEGWEFLIERMEGAAIESVLLTRPLPAGDEAHA